MNFLIYKEEVEEGKEIDVRRKSNFIEDIPCKSLPKELSQVLIDSKV